MNLFTTLHRSDFSVGRIVYVGFVYKIENIQNTGIVGLLCFKKNKY